MSNLFWGMLVGIIAHVSGWIASRLYSRWRTHKLSAKEGKENSR